MMRTMDRLLTTAKHEGWGTVLAAGTLAIHLVWTRPALANRYLLIALAGAGTVRFPDGSPLPVGEYPLEVMLWMSGYSAKSDEEADSWLETITRFTPEQLEMPESVGDDGRQRHDSLRWILAPRISSSRRQIEIGTTLLRNLTVLTEPLV